MDNRTCVRLNSDVRTRNLQIVFEHSGFEKRILTSSSSISLPAPILLDIVTLLYVVFYLFSSSHAQSTHLYHLHNRYDRNINLEIQNATRLSLASLCCSSSSSQIHIAMSWRLLTQCSENEYQARMYLLRGRLHQRAGHMKDSLQALQIALKFAKKSSLCFEIENRIQEINIARIIQQVKTYASIFQDTSIEKSERENAAKNTIDLILKTFESPFQNHSYLYNIFEKDVSMLIALSRAFEISESRNEDVVNFISECVLLVLGLGNDSNTFLGQVLPTLRRVVTRHRVLNNTTLHRALIAISSFIVQDGGVVHIHSLAEICNHTGHFLFGHGRTTSGSIVQLKHDVCYEDVVV